MMKLKQALNHASSQLEANSDSARRDAEILLSQVLKKSRAYLFAHPERQLSLDEEEDFSSLIAKRKTGYPVAYIQGEREFWSLPLRVNEATLIPRPETEGLVEWLLTEMADKKQASILDLGTGSGAIALALAHERKDWQILAIDYSLEALNIAKENAAHLGVKNVEFYQSNWFASLEEGRTFTAIVANPPYLAADDPHLKALSFEPEMALISGKNGLADIEHIIEQGVARLRDQGLLLIEHGFTQKETVLALLEHYGYVETRCRQDLQGHDRMSMGKRKI